MKEAVLGDIDRWYSDYYPNVKEGPSERLEAGWEDVEVCQGSWVDTQLLYLAANAGPSKSVIKATIGQFLLKRDSVRKLQSSVRKKLTDMTMPDVARWRTSLRDLNKSHIDAAEGPGELGLSVWAVHRIDVMRRSCHCGWKVALLVIKQVLSDATDVVRAGADRRPNNE